MSQRIWPTRAFHQRVSVKSSLCSKTCHYCDFNKSQSGKAECDINRL
jgi:2-iminoacetate synthase ThiH